MKMALRQVAIWLLLHRRRPTFGQDNLPDSWSGTVTPVSSLAGTVKFTFEDICDLILGEVIRRKNAGGYSSGLLSTKSRGRMTDRGQGSGNGGARSRRRRQSKSRVDIQCRSCKENDNFTKGRKK